MKEIIIKVEGMMCNGCENRIQNALNNVNGVEKVIANHKNGIVEITAKENVEIKVIKELIDDLGFTVKEN